MCSYNFKCCISGINNPELLEACHIVEWSKDILNRTNPKNGLCMNTFFHKAYDRYLLAITPDLSIIISDELFKSATETTFFKYLKELNGKKYYYQINFSLKKNYWKFITININ
ncbi:HNH endonuclease signature motif containing protein [Prevotella sp. OH937_COT-195]|uniref:HNH endonuclease n=1 Tax=Prevotella sp. OH937_COT-195 TaxID=2491051 RepID=UPI0013159B47